MEQCMDAIRPDAVVHLGDMVRDADALAAEYPNVPFYQVAGNCDSGRVPMDYPEIRIEKFSGVLIYMTHGHRQGVKTFLGKLVADGQKCDADIILYGHTHCTDCWRTEGGCWVMNPGSAGYGYSAGVIEINENREINCIVIRPADLEG